MIQITDCVKIVQIFINDFFSYSLSLAIKGKGREIRLRRGKGEVIHVLIYQFEAEYFSHHGSHFTSSHFIPARSNIWLLLALT